MSKNAEKRSEILVTLSVGILIYSDSGDELLLVKNREKQSWGIPAGGLEKIGERLETVDETMEREILEETGLDVNDSRIWLTHPSLVGVINLAGTDKHRIGIIYEAAVNMYALEKHRIVLTPHDFNEIEEAKFLPEKSIEELIRDGKMYKPHFNLGLIRWALLNTAEAAFMGRNIRSSINEVYAAEYANGT